MALPLPDDRAPNLEKYEILEELGHGGMATVYRARDVRLGREVAVKVMHPHLRNSAEIAHRFFSEARAVAMLRHPNIVEVYDVSSEDDRERFLVVELVRGKTLRKALAEVGVMPPEVAAALVLELLSALGHAHSEGVIHRDVKPENVLIEIERSREEGKTPRVIVKLTDFGIAKLLDAQGVTSTGQVLGSPAHMAPEQIDGAEVDGRADVFGLGVLAYECMVGHLPFEGSNPAQVLRRVLEGRYPSGEHEVPEIGKRWSAILDRALAGSRDERFPDARAMKDAVVNELNWIGATDTQSLLSQFFADPEAFRAAHGKRMLAKLTEAGHEARKHGDMLAAAAAFNRALAYSPSDPKLLRLVSGLQKAERRRKFVRALVPRVLVGALVATISYAVVRGAVREKIDAALSRAVTPRPTAVASSPSGTPTASASAVTSVTTAVTVVPVRPVPKPISRSVLLRSLHPSNGVLLSVDGSPIGEARDNFRLTLDGNPHKLEFSCVNDLCEPEKRTIGAGTTDEEIESIDLRIRPAKVIVMGKAGMHYQIPGTPPIDLVSGVEATVPTGKRGSVEVKIVELETSESKTVNLLAGRSYTVRFL